MLKILYFCTCSITYLLNKIYKPNQTECRVIFLDIDKKSKSKIALFEANIILKLRLKNFTEHKENIEMAFTFAAFSYITALIVDAFLLFFSIFQLYEEGEIQGTIAELMTEQVEFSNVVILNKQDLVSEEQKADILDRIHLLNPKAKVLHSLQSKVDVKEILNTNLYSRYAYSL